MTSSQALTTQNQGRNLKLWEIILCAIATPLFFGSLWVYFTDYPLLRHYLFSAPIAPESGAVIGSLTTATGKVRLQRANESEFVTISPGTPVHNEDTIVTDPGANASVSLDGGGKIDLAPDTMVRLAFDADVSIGGITRQPKIQLVTGSVSGESSKEKAIVVQTRNGKAATITAENGEVIQEKPVAPKKVEFVETPVTMVQIEEIAVTPPPLEIFSEEKKEDPPEEKLAEAKEQEKSQEKPQEAASPEPQVLASAAPEATPMASPSPETLAGAPKDEPVASPSPAAPPLVLSQISPADSASFDPPKGAESMQVQVPISFDVSRADASVQVRVYTIKGSPDSGPLNQTISATNSKVSVIATITLPGKYEWTVEDAATKAILVKQQFQIARELQGLQLLEASVPGSKGNTNVIAEDVVAEFPGTLFQWKAVADAEEYELILYADEKKSKKIYDKEVRENSFLYSKGGMNSKPLYFTVSATLKTGFVVKSEVGKTQFKFLPPDMIHPKNGQAVTQKSAAQPILLTWSHTNFTENYFIEIAKDASFKEKLVSEDTEENFYAFQPETKGTYYWRVQSKASSIQSDLSKTRNFKVQ